VILFVSMVVGGGVAWERGQIVGPSKGSIQALVVPHSQCSVQFSVINLIFLHDDGFVVVGRVWCWKRISNHVYSYFLNSNSYSRQSSEAIQQQ
jgi:hypothetical protein